MKQPISLLLAAGDFKWAGALLFTGVPVDSNTFSEGSDPFEVKRNDIIYRRYGDVLFYYGEVYRMYIV